MGRRHPRPGLRRPARRVSRDEGLLSVKSQVHAGFAEAWPEPEFVQQPVGQIPWGHNLVLVTKLKDRAARLAYAASALEHGWSRAVLVHHIEARTVERQGKALTNFAERLPKPQSDLARETLNR